MRRTKRPLLGRCGEHYVASFLFGMGLEVTLTKPGTKLIDLHVRRPKGNREMSIQVKTGGTAFNHVEFSKTPDESYYVWPVGTRAFGHSSPTHWYAFVSMGKWPLKIDAATPEIYFVPSHTVVKILRENTKNHRDWFWMNDQEIQQYRGVFGYRKLSKHFAKK